MRIKCPVHLDTSLRVHRQIIVRSRNVAKSLKICYLFNVNRMSLSY